MKASKVIKFAVVGMLTVFGFVGAATVTSNHAEIAHAKTTKVVKVSYSKISKKAYHVTNGSFYSTSHLTKVNHYGKNYKHTTFYSYKKATIKKSNHKSYSYVYVKSSDKKVSGWIWHSYLKSGKAPAVKKSSSTSSKSGNTNTGVTKPVTVKIYGPISTGNKVIASGNISYKKGATVFSVLQTLSKQKGFKIGYSGSGSSAYITMINGKYAGSGGAGGGWLYSVNGTYSSYSAGAYKVKSGDVVQWVWTQGSGDRGWNG